jgi:hypothetical protein
VVRPGDVSHDSCSIHSIHDGRSTISSISKPASGQHHILHCVLFISGVVGVQRNMVRITLDEKMDPRSGLGSCHQPECVCVQCTHVRDDGINIEADGDWEMFLADRQRGLTKERY